MEPQKREYYSNDWGIWILFGSIAGIVLLMGYYDWIAVGVAALLVSVVIYGAARAYLNQRRQPLPPASPVSPGPSCASVQPPAQRHQ